MPTPIPTLLSGLGHLALVAAGLLVYVLVTRMRQQRRHPSAAIAWVAVIALLPYVGIPLFLAIGTRKFARPAAPAAAADRPARDLGTPPWATDLLAGLGVPAPGRARAVTFHEDGAQALAALIALAGAARHRLEICTYVLGADAVGAMVADALVEAAGRGVRVRLLIDALGSRVTPRPLLERLRAQGVEARRFMPLLHNPTRGSTNLRNHRKLAVADDARLWCGGRNLASEYFFDHRGGPAWRDLSVVVDGGIALQARRQFDRDWALAGGSGADERPIAAAGDEAGGPVVQWIPSGPDYADDTLYALLLAGAFHARQRIAAVTPYFVPDDALLDAWCLASRRGVQVSLVLPLRSNHRLADWARERALRRLAQAGAEIFMTSQMVHAKAIVIDNDIALCGSVNIDGRSLFLNFEAMAAFYGPAQVAWLAGWSRQLAQAGAPYRAVPPTWWRDLGEGVARSIGFQL